MSRGQRRRFHLLALMAVIALTSICSYFIAAFELLPRRQETWIDISSARVQKRDYVCGVWTRTTNPREYNCLAVYCEKLDELSAREPEWLRSSTTTYRLGPSEHGFAEFTEYVLMEVAIARMSVMVDDSSKALRLQKSGMSINQPARELLASNFLAMLRDGASPQVLDNYALASDMRFWELNREITPDDIISADTWLADPVREHYYGPERIY